MYVTSTLSLWQCVYSFDKSNVDENHEIITFLKQVMIDTDSPNFIVLYAYFTVASFGHFSIISQVFLSYFLIISRKFLTYVFPISQLFLICFPVISHFPTIFLISHDQLDHRLYIYLLYG